VSGFVVSNVENSVKDLECLCHPSTCYIDENVEEANRFVNEDR
jgi:hypothetical protein